MCVGIGRVGVTKWKSQVKPCNSQMWTISYLVGPQTDLLVDKYSAAVRTLGFKKGMTCRPDTVGGPH